MNDIGQQKELKGRAVTDEWMTKAWPVFNGRNTRTDGVSKDDLLLTLYDIEIALWLTNSQHWYFVIIPANIT